MARPVGNPNIGEISKEKSTGPKTPVGKLISSVARFKNKPPRSAFLSEISPDSMAAKVVNFDNSTPEALKKSIEAYHNFVNWALQRKSPTKDLSEITKLEGMLHILEAQISKALGRLAEGKELTDKDRKDLFLMKDTLVSISEMKYGKKQLNVTASYKDIRDLMFEE